MVTTESNSRGNSVPESGFASNKVSSVIRKHPAVWFFVIAFAISWTIWLAGATIAKGSGIGFTAAFAPAISAIFVAACMNPTPSHASVKKRIALFVIVLAITVAVSIQTISYSSNPEIGPIVVIFVTAIITAYVFSCYYHPIQGVSQVFSGLNQKGKKPIWLLIAFGLPLAFQIGGALINLALGINLFGNVTVALITLLATGVPYMFIFGGPSGEEPGWRGFATPQMQKYLNPLFVGIIIGILWTAWHLPLYFTGDYAGGVNAAIFRFAWNVPLGILFAWVYNKSNGNLLAALLLHTSNNLFVTLFTSANQNMDWVVAISFTVVVVVVTKFWKTTNNLPTIQTAPLKPQQTAIPAT
jgi:membrane protease YdiL (CAAX protease family)